MILKLITTQNLLFFTDDLELVVHLLYLPFIICNSTDPFLGVLYNENYPEFHSGRGRQLSFLFQGLIQFRGRKVFMRIILKLTYP